MESIAQKQAEQQFDIQRICILKERPSAVYDVQICGQDSFWMNPFAADMTMPKEERIRKYHRVLFIRLREQRKLYWNELKKLSDIYTEWNCLRLFCVCPPNDYCHGDVISLAVTRFLKGELKCLL